jgi:SPW repeat
MTATDTRPTPGQDPDADVPELTAPELAPGDVAPVVDPSPQFYRDARGGATAAGLLTLFVGGWLIASPFVLGYVAGDSRLNPMIVGALVAFLALTRLSAWRVSSLSWVNVAAGAWLFASGFWLAESSAASWNAWIFGLAVIVLALVTIDAGEEGRMRSSVGGRQPARLR